MSDKGIKSNSSNHHHHHHRSSSNNRHSKSSTSNTIKKEQPKSASIIEDDIIPVKVKKEPHIKDSNDSISLDRKRKRSSNNTGGVSSTSNNRYDITGYSGNSNNKIKIESKVTKRESNSSQSQSQSLKKEDFSEKSTKDLTNIITQYSQTENYNNTNNNNTQQVHTIIKELENYVFRMYSEGEVTTTLFSFCNKLIEIIQQWNNNITLQQRNMKDFVLNAITYNTALHDMSIEMTKKNSFNNNSGHHYNKKYKRDPTSPFNTIQTNIDKIDIPNNNNAIKNKLNSNNSTTSPSINNNNNNNNNMNINEKKQPSLSSIF
jgi:hypothetical protein